MIQTTTRPALEVADILRAHGDAYRQQRPVSPEQAAVLTQLIQCRTAALGGHLDHCETCGFQRVSYNSCRNRHCPKCQASCLGGNAAQPGAAGEVKILRRTLTPGAIAHSRSWLASISTVAVGVKLSPSRILADFHDRTS